MNHSLVWKGKKHWFRERVKEIERERVCVWEQQRALEPWTRVIWHRRLWSKSHGCFWECWWLCVDSSPQSSPSLSTSPSCPLSISASLFFHPSFSPSLCFSILHHQPPILHLHTSFTDISPYREHIKKMYSSVVNHTNPIFSEMRWGQEETTGRVQGWFMYIQKDRTALSSRTEVKLFEILCCITLVVWCLQGLVLSCVWGDWLS